jgi:hypothetical protein
MPYTIDSPSPAEARGAAVSGSKTWLSVSGSMAEPVSLTASTT